MSEREKIVEVISNGGEIWPITARNIVAALTAAGYSVVPTEPTLDMLDAGHEAARKVRIAGAGGMTLDAQLRREAAREYAAYRAMLAAAQES